MSRRVLVTGAASGLGAALVAAFREHGDEVLATDRVAAEGIDLVLDITSGDDWAAAVEAVEQRWGGLDVLVNNAGVAGGGRIDRCTIEEWRQITEVNLFGIVRGMQAFTPMLKAQGSGHLVNVASLAGLVHPAGMGSYNATKAAVVAFTETCGHELAGFGIRASAVCPSYFRTNLMRLDAGQRRPPSARSSGASSSAPRSPPTRSPPRCWPGWTPVTTSSCPTSPPARRTSSSGPTGRRTTQVMRAQAAKLEESDV